MKRVMLSGACPPMPRTFHERIVSTIEGLEEPKTPRRKISVALVAALIAALLLAGLAYAATQSGILWELFGDRPPSGAAQVLLVQPGKSAEQNGVKLTVDEYLLDGNTLHMICTFLSSVDDPLVCGLKFPTVNGVPVAGGSFSRGFGMDAPVDLKQGRPVTLRMSAILDALDTTKPMEIRVTGYAMKPLVDLKALNPGVEAQEGVYDLLTGEASKLFSEDVTQAEADIYEKLGYTKTVAALPISITVQPEALKAATHTAALGRDTFDFPEYTFKVVRLDFGAASTMVELRLYPKRPFHEYDERGHNDDPLIDRWYALLGPDGTDLTLGLVGGWGGGIEQDKSGTYYCWNGDWGPIDPPESVTIAPFVGSTSTPEHRNYIPGEAVTIPLAK